MQSSFIHASPILYTVHSLYIRDNITLDLDPHSPTKKNLRGPRVARQQQLLIDICCPRPTPAANPPAAAAEVDRWDRRTDGHLTVL